MKVRLIATAMLGFSVALTLGADLKDPEGKEKEQEPAKQELKEGEFVKETPFGPMKQGPPKKTDKLAGAQFVEVEEQGDLVIFRRSTPFGKQVWKTKRSDLSEVEKQFMEEQRRRAKSNAGGEKPQAKKVADSKSRTSSESK